MNTQTNQSPADGRLAKQQANDRGGVVSWGEHVSDDVRIRPSLVLAGAARRSRASAHLVVAGIRPARAGRRAHTGASARREEEPR